MNCYKVKPKKLWHLSVVLWRIYLMICYCIHYFVYFCWIANFNRHWMCVNWAVYIQGFFHRVQYKLILLYEKKKNFFYFRCPDYESGGSRRGARGTRGPGGTRDPRNRAPGPPLVWVKKEEIRQGRKAGRASKTKPTPSQLKVWIRHCVLLLTR